MTVRFDLIILSVVVGFGIVFLLWVLYHVSVESRQARSCRRHIFSRQSSVGDRSASHPERKNLASVLILTVIDGTVRNNPQRHRERMYG
jgi:hypothetical protein